MAARRALLSVSDKRGIVDLSRALVGGDFEILSSGGTARTLRAAGVPVVEVASYTGSPEILDGRVKTLHPRIHAGILARDTPEHVAELERHGIAPIDLVVVNLYPFREAVSHEGHVFEEAIEQIDIGGPAMVRAAAKNFERVGVVVDPNDYVEVAGEIQRRGALSDETRLRLARKAFAHTADYDAAVAVWLASHGPDAPELSPFPRTLAQIWTLAQALRYGENPHQIGALYREPDARGWSVAAARQLQGKELSYNNLLDADAALALLRDLAGTAACIIKHANPCGAALGSDAAQAFASAFACDPTSAFGGIVGVTVAVDAALARALGEPFLEVVLAPSFSPEALAILAKKKNIRLLEVGPRALLAGEWQLRSIAGGVLLQSRDDFGLNVRDGRVVSRREPTPAEYSHLDFAWRVCKHARSNAIVLARDGATAGIGAGQMSRVDSVRIAVEKAGERARGAALASDAFFPFRDGVDAAAAAGVTAIAHPGGSVRDAEVIAAADEHGMAMVTTGFRHFRH